MNFKQDIKEIRRELSYAVEHNKDGHDSTVVAVMLQVRLLVDRTLKHLSERSQHNDKAENRATRTEQGETEA